MALAATHTFAAGEVLTAANLNAMNTNILNNAITLISPLTAGLDCGGFDLTVIDEIGLSDAGAAASAAGRLRRNGSVLDWASANNGGLKLGAVSGTPAQHALYRDNMVKFWAFVTVAAGAPTVAASFNVASITDTAVGQLTITIDRDFASVNYAVTVSVQAVFPPFTDYSAQAAGSVVVRATDTSFAFADPVNWSVIGIGAQ